MIAILICLFASAAFAQSAADHVEKKELIGQLSLSDILIQPRFSSNKNHFDLDRSYAFISWKMDNQISAHFGVGQSDLTNQNFRIHPTADFTNGNIVGSKYRHLSFFEAFGQLDSKYGQVKAGLVPLMFGWEGGRRESDWIFPRTLFYGGNDPSYAMQNFSLRAYGVQYNVAANNFYTYLTLHNGDDDTQPDGKIWETGRVGWKTPSGVEVAASFSNGKYSEQNTIPTERFSYVNLFGSFEFYHMFALVEGFYGSEKIEVPDGGVQPNKINFWDAHADFGHPITKNLTGLFRFEEYNPNSRFSDARAARYIFGLEYSNELRTSNLFVWWTVNKQGENFMAAQGLDQVYGNTISSSFVRGNEVMVVWKVRSLSIF